MRGVGSERDEHERQQQHQAGHSACPRQERADLEAAGDRLPDSGKAIFVVPPEVTEEQLGCLAQIYTGQLGGMPWAILGTTFEVAGVVRAEIELDDNGMNSGFTIPGVGEARGERLKNPVTGEEHGVAIVLDEGFIWKRGDCGQGTFDVEAEGIHLAFENTNWILYDFEWSNAE